MILRPARAHRSSGTRNVALLCAHASSANSVEPAATPKCNQTTGPLISTADDCSADSASEEPVAEVSNTVAPNTHARPVICRLLHTLTINSYSPGHTHVHRGRRGGLRSQAPALSLDSPRHPGTFQNLKHVHTIQNKGQPSLRNNVCCSKSAESRALGLPAPPI